MGWVELSEQAQANERAIAPSSPEVTEAPPTPEPQPEVAPVEEPQQPVEAPAPEPEPISEPVEVPAADSPFGDHGLDASPGAITPQEVLQQAIESGDKYRVIQALAAMGVNTTDELLSHILLPPGT